MNIPNKFNPFGLTKKDEGGGMPTDGLVFYMPLSGSNILEEVVGNRTMHSAGDITSAYFGNINCAYFGDWEGKYIYNNDERGDLPIGDHSLSLSIWVSNEHLYQDQTYFFYGTQDTDRCLWIFYNGEQIAMGAWNGDLATYFSPPVRKWVHYVAVYDKDEQKFYSYINGQYISEKEVYDVNFNFGQIGIGCRDNSWDSIYQGLYMAGARIYDRALTSGEVETLYSEFTPLYDIVAPDPQVIKFYPYGYTYGIKYDEPLFPVTSFEITSGTLPNNITFNTSTGEFTGTALTDARHNYTLYVKMSGNNLKDKTIVVLISTFPETYLSAPSPQNFSFISERGEQKEIELNKYYDDAYVDVVSGSLPTGVSVWSYGGGINIDTDGQQLTAESTSAVISVYTDYHQEPIEITLNVDVALNRIYCDNQTIKFFTAEGMKSESIKISSDVSTDNFTPYFNLSGTLPSGIIFSEYSGTFTYDGTSPVTSGIVNVEVTSNTGCSIPASATITLQIIEGERQAPDDYSFYFPMTGVINVGTILPTGQEFYSKTAYYVTSANFQGINCLYNPPERRGTTYAWTFTTDGIAVGNAPRTISYWINFDSTNGTMTPVLYGYRGYGDPDWGGWVRIRTDNVVDFAYFDYDFRNEGTGELKSNTWYNIVVTIDLREEEWNPGELHNYVRYYINGVGYGEPQIDGINTTSGLYLTLWGDDWDMSYGGYMTDLRIYNRVLNDNEISALANSHKYYNINDQDFIFVTNNGSETKQIEFSSNDNVILTLSGTLPSGITFNSSTYELTSDGTQTTTNISNLIAYLTKSNDPNTILASANIGINVYHPTSNPIISNGLTLYMPLSSSLNSEVGVPLSTVTQTSPTLTSEDNIPCYYFNGANVLANISKTYFKTFKEGEPRFTICFWFKQDTSSETYENNDSFAVQGGLVNTDTGRDGCWNIMVGQTEGNFNKSWMGAFGYGYEDTWITDGDANQWHFYALLVDYAWETYTCATPFTESGYKDPTQYAMPPINSPAVCLGNALVSLNGGTATFRNDTNFIKGWYTGLRVYNRVLNISELSDLAAEHPLNQ